MAQNAWGRGRSKVAKMHIVVAGATTKQYGDITYCKRWVNGIQYISLETARQIGFDSESLCAACAKRARPQEVK